jgi:hypothetical protein
MERPRMRCRMFAEARASQASALSESTACSRVPRLVCSHATQVRAEPAAEPAALCRSARRGLRHQLSDKAPPQRRHHRSRRPREDDVDGGHYKGAALLLCTVVCLMMAWCRALKRLCRRCLQVLADVGNAKAVAFDQIDKVQAPSAGGPQDPALACAASKAQAAKQAASPLLSSCCPR